MRRSSLWGVALLTIATLSEAAPKLDAPITNRIKTAIDVALTPVRFSQSRADGSYGDERTTALVVRAFMESHRRYNEEDGPFITRALDFLRSHDGPGHWLSREALSRSSKKTDPSLWPEELVSELAPASKLRDPSILAFAVETVLRSEAPLDDRFWEAVLGAVAASGEPSAASDYVRTLAALAALAEKSGHFDRGDLARLLASRCASIRTSPQPYHHYYFLAATLETLVRASQDIPAGCAAELAELLLSRQQFDGFWPPSEDEAERDELRTTSLAILALAALGEI